ncbi:pantothenate transporter liz1 [Coccidioides immitis H538.4]|uniref:Pantothenate transporter liz1 n=1 Tax=Coccidioides immitis H538.4 TaxID=396776 RepID=A0A0J8UFP2_COCIT|nr:pantothenate transporter liz1 [Coccidioides immitis H538.4]
MADTRDGLEHQRDELNCHKKHSMVENEELKEDTVRVSDQKAECALCLKFDIRILPVLAIMYLFNALDKGNIGNAQTAGLSKGLYSTVISHFMQSNNSHEKVPDFNFKPGQYNLLLGIFFVPYVIFAPPIAMIGKHFGPARMLPILMLIFGSLTLLSAATHNFGGIFAFRWFLGMAEAAFFPLVIYYLTTFYRRGELARRLAIFYAASNIANAFSGLLSFGVFQVKSGKLKEWRYLFLIEGACTVIFAIFAYWYLPQAPAEARFLDPKEKALAFHRIQVDSSSIVNEKFNFREALTVFKQPTSYIFLAIEVCIGVPIQSVALFLPQIIQRLERDTVTTNLYTVAPNCTGAVMLLILAFSSDACRLRSPFIAFGFLLSFTGFHDLCCHRRCQGSIRAGLLCLLYDDLGNLRHPQSPQHFNIFREEDKPKYKPALITTGTFGAAGALLAGSLGVYMAWDNRQRNKKQGVKIDTRDIPTKHLRDGPDTPEFRWFL